MIPLPGVPDIILVMAEEVFVVASERVTDIAGAFLSEKTEEQKGAQKIPSLLASFLSK